MKADETRTLILQSAMEMIVQNGFDATSVSNICQHAGISKGAFYYHFESKQTLFLELLNLWLAELDSAFELIKGSEEQLGVQLENMAKASNMIFTSIKDPLPTFLAFWSKAIQEPKIWQEAIKPFTTYQAAFEAMLVNSSNSGNAADLSAKDASKILVGMAIGILLQGIIYPEDADWQDILLKAVHLFSDGWERSER